MQTPMDQPPSIPQSPADYNAPRAVVASRSPVEIAPSFRSWLWLAIAIAGFAATFAVARFDAAINDSFANLADKLPGDVRREWAALQQFGQGTVTILLIIVIWIMDPRRRTRLFDLGAAAVCVGLATIAAKILMGRPRPLLRDPESLVGALGVYPIPQSDGSVSLAHSWEKAGSPELWSMPSSHTAFAVMLAVFLSMLYPRLAWLAALLAVIVGSGRLVFDAHWASDVLAGATLAWLIAYPLIAGRPASRRLAAC